MRALLSDNTMKALHAGTILSAVVGAVSSVSSLARQVHPVSSCGPTGLVQLTSGDVKLDVNCSDGSFAITAAGNSDHISISGGASSHLAPPSASGQGVSVVDVVQHSGSDPLGQFNEIMLSYAYEGAPSVTILNTVFRAYSSDVVGAGELITFSQQFPQGYTCLLYTSDAADE